MSLSSKKCIKKLNKYWDTNYSIFSENAEFGCDTENEMTYSWHVKILNNEFEIQINKNTGVIREKRKH